MSISIIPVSITAQPNMMRSKFAIVLLTLIRPIVSQTLTPPGPPIDSKTYTAPQTAKYNYVDALHKSFLFYWAQRSGKQPYDRLAWRTDSCLDCRGDYGEDLSGGWYEAANTMKWGGPFGFTVMQLAWNVIEFGGAMRSVGEEEEAKMWVRHGAEYLLNVYSRDEGTQEERLVGVFGVSAAVINGKNEDIDFGYFGPPEEYSQWAPFNYGRKAFYCTGSPTLNKGCSDIAADYAAALAAAAIILRPTDPTYADRCLAMSKTIYTFGTRYVNSYQDPIFTETGWKNYKEWYPSTSYTDDLSLAATFLYLATNDASYLTAAETYSSQSDLSEYSWADKAIASTILIYRQSKSASLRTRINDFFARYLPGGSLPRTPRGLVYLYQWGSLRYAANVAFLALVYAKIIQSEDTGLASNLRTFAIQQINYILGDCGRSWVVGFGESSPKLPYHKGSYNSFIDYPLRGKDNSVIGDDFLHSRTPNRFILYGALVGGPNADDTYVDNREDYVYTEVTQDYNAAFSGALAGLIDYYGTANFQRASDCGLDLGWSHPNALTGGRSKPVYASGDCYHTCDACSSQSAPNPGTSNINYLNNVPGNQSSNTKTGPPGGDQTATSTGSKSPNFMEDAKSAGMSKLFGVYTMLPYSISGKLPQWVRPLIVFFPTLKRTTF
ncbi:hypothetical protein HDV00_001061 [Rhizophlyctis rosea]|nr:hypothetical protein HDV00_001061 [Rhizophlyctis rosea]